VGNRQAGGAGGDWISQERLREAVGYFIPAEYEAALTGASHPASQTPALATD
jgi:putative transposase